MRGNHKVHREQDRRWTKTGIVEMLLVDAALTLNLGKIDGWGGLNR